MEGLPLDFSPRFLVPWSNGDRSTVVLFYSYTSLGVVRLAVAHRRGRQCCCRAGEEKSP
jgi:hypothetical protein